MNRFWNIVNADEDGGERELHLEGTIAEESWFDDDVTPKAFREELFGQRGPVRLYINSPGGDCVAASQIYTMLMEYPGDVVGVVDGMAASAASVIAMACTKLVMSPTALLMIHNPLTMAFGNKADMEKAIALLDEVKESIVNAYEIKTGLSRAKISHMMDDETWLSANKAFELGFCDEVLSESPKTVIPMNFAYSRNAVTNNLTNKVCAKLRAQEPKGVPIDSLYERLNKLKH